MSRFRQEIGEQPEVVSRLLARREPVAAIGERVRQVRPGGLTIAARGSSDNAAQYAKYLFGSRNRLLVALAAPSLFTRYGRPPRLDGQCVIGISQSGATPDVIAVVEEARRQGLLTIAITNDAGSKLAAAAELAIALSAGPEQSVPASKTYTASLMALALVSQAVDPDGDFEAALARVPGAIAGVIETEAELEPLAAALTGHSAVVLSRGFNLSTAEEIALKLSEVAQVMTRAWSFADFEHGPVALLEPGLPVILVHGGGPAAADVESVRQRVVAEGCQALALVDTSGLPEELTPITLAVQGQLLAHRVALARGIDPDRTRIARKVTRTW